MLSRFPSNLAALFLWLLVTIQVAAQTPPLDIRGGLGDQVVEPGRIVTRNFIVENRSPASLELVEDLELPAGWTRIATSDPVFTVARGASLPRLVSVSVPKNATAQNHTVIYRLRDRRSNAVLGELKLELSVRPTGRLTVSLADKPTSVLAGEKATLPLSFSNRGNCPVQVTVEWKVSPDTKVVAPGREFTVEAGASRDLSLEIQSDASLTNRLLQLVQIKVSATWAGGGQATIPVETLTYEVLPQRPSSFDPYLRLPARLTTSFGWENGRAPGFQTELSGRGALDDKGQRQLDFMVRSPDSGGPNGSLRRQEEYGVSYFSPTWDLHLGDRNFPLTPLTQSLGNSRGVKFDWHPGPTSAGFFASQGRSAFDPHEESGGYLRRDFSDGLAAQASVLHSNAGTNGVARQLYSLLGTWNLTNRLALSAEAAFDDSAPSPAKGLGWRGEARGILGEEFVYSVAHSFAGTDFHGAVSDSETTTASVYYPLSENLRLTGSLQNYANNLGRDPLRAQTSTDDLVWRTGLRYRVSHNTDLSLEYQDTRRRDTLAPVDYDYAERALRLGIAHNFGKVSVDLSQELGHATDHVSGRVNPLSERTTISAILRATDRQNYSAFISYGDNDMSVGAQKTVVASVGGNWQPTPATSVSSSLAHELNAATSRTKDSVNASLGWTRANGHILSATARYAKASDRSEPEASVFLSYSIPQGIPVGRKTGFGTIQGCVLDADAPGRGPITKAVVRLNSGETTVTDRSGRFVFAGLKPGNYAVSVDSHSLGFGRVTADLIPETLVVKKDSVITLDLAVVSAATLTVQMTIFEEPLTPLTSGHPAPTAPQERYRPLNGMAGEIVEISNSHETYRRQTDAKGAAVFGSLRPGVWKLKAYDSAMPANHFLEKAERELEIKVADRVTEVVRVLPRRRMLKLIDGGSLN